MRRGLVVIACVLLASCARADSRAILTFSGSAVGREAAVLRTQLARFTAERGIPVEIRVTPDSADQRHQLYVQWLNARAPAPDVLQLDVVWTPEFAAAGWLLPLDDFNPGRDAFFPATIEANSWRGGLYGLPWFVDVGMLYWRTDVFEAPPATFEALATAAAGAQAAKRIRYGLVWQGARYEGLITVFVEYLGAFGGSILEGGHVVVDSEAAVRALTTMRDHVHREGIVPAAALTWHEEETRFAFQNGSAAAMRNWPYAFSLLQGTDSSVAGRFAVAAMPAATADGAPTAALGGSQLAINAHSRRADDAWALIEYLTAPQQMLERARVVAQFPSRPALFEPGAGLDDSLGIAPSTAREIIAAARPRPVTPVYTQLSEILQVHVHNALTRQEEPRLALQAAAREIRALLHRSGLAAHASRP